jgi:hypothetical protein
MAVSALHLYNFLRNLSKNQELKNEKRAYPKQVEIGNDRPGTVQPSDALSNR